MPEGRQPRGVTRRPRSGAAAESARLQQRRSSQEELPHTQGQGFRPRRATPHPRSRVAAERSYPTPPMPEARGSSWEDQPHVQGAVAARAQEGLEALSHVEGQEGRRDRKSVV